MKRYLAIFLTVILALGLFSACGAENTQQTIPMATQPSTTPEVTEPAVTQPEKDPVTICWWIYEDPVMKPLLQLWLDRLQEAYPWIVVDITWISRERGDEKMQSAISSGEYPDILWDTYSNLAPVIDSGKVVSLEPAVENITGLAALKLGVSNGVHYYLPTEIPAGAAIACNMTLARELGIEEFLPQDGLTWSYDDFLSCLRKAKQAGKFGIDLYAGSIEDDMWYYSWLLGADVEILNPKKGELLANTSEYRSKALRVLELFQTIVKEKLCQDGAENISAADARAIWYTGEMLFSHAAFDDAAMLQNLYEDGASQVAEFALFAQPTYDGRTGGGDCTAEISKGLVAFDTQNGEKLEAVYTAIAYLYSREGGFFQSLTQQKPQTAALLSWLEPDLSKMDDVVAQMTLQRGDAYTQAHCRSDWGCEKPWFSDFRKTLIPYLSYFFDGDVSAKKMLSRWESDAKKTIAAYKAS